MTGYWQEISPFQKLTGTTKESLVVGKFHVWYQLTILQLAFDVKFPQNLSALLLFGNLMSYASYHMVNWHLTWISPTTKIVTSYGFSSVSRCKVQTYLENFDVRFQLLSRFLASNIDFPHNNCSFARNVIYETN